jgi:hypothetical protein
VTATKKSQATVAGAWIAQESRPTLIAAGAPRRSRRQVTAGRFEPTRSCHSSATVPQRGQFVSDPIFAEHTCWRNIKVRTNKYLNNLIEQDHRAIKRRCASMADFKSFDNAAITIAGIELAHRTRMNQFSFGRGRRRRGWSRKAEWAVNRHRNLTRYAGEPASKPDHA